MISNGLDCVSPAIRYTHRERLHRKDGNTWLSHLDSLPSHHCYIEIQQVGEGGYKMAYHRNGAFFEHDTGRPILSGDVICWRYIEQGLESEPQAER